MSGDLRKILFYSAKVGEPEPGNPVPIEIEVAEALTIFQQWLSYTLQAYEASYRRLACLGCGVDDLHFGDAKSENEKFYYGRTQGISLARDELLNSLPQS